MLEYLRIKNLALIKDMELEFSPGINVLTGETGAGKSFILKAINFLTGDKLNQDIVRQDADKASVEALFLIKNENLIIRRELLAETGRSRIYINDQLSSQDTLKELKNDLIIHASQHGQQKLLQAGFQAQLLDSFMNKSELIEKKDNILKELRFILNQKNEIEIRYKDLTEKRDLLEYQNQEIEKVNPGLNEEDKLENLKLRIKSQEHIKRTIENSLDCVYNHEYGLSHIISQLETNLAALNNYIPENAAYKEYLEATGNYRSVLSDLGANLRSQPNYMPEQNDSSNNLSLNDLDARLFELAQLKRKLKRTLPEILNLKEEIAGNISFLDACNLDLKQLEQQEIALSQELSDCLNVLNFERRKTAKALSQELENALRGLGFSEHIQVDFSFSSQEIYSSKKFEMSCFEDKARLIWIPNPGQTPQPLDKIASGGELSRFLLAIIGVIAQNETPTLIFDEVDAGIGGLTLNKVAERLNLLAENNQVILISHWPQLAAIANKHFYVRKDIINNVTHTFCHNLNSEEIFEELVRMGGGGQQGLSLAKELTKK